MGTIVGIKITLVAEATLPFKCYLVTYCWAFFWKWNWHRCQGVALNEALRAAFRPLWASEVIRSGMAYAAPLESGQKSAPVGLSL